jgi:EAL domain-containing protein (putative c-di-GMP-specific phosphodiesterase class I)
VTAEGIEMVEQLHELQALGCDHGQGFLLARPAPARVITSLLAGGDSLLRSLVAPAATVA